MMKAKLRNAHISLGVTLPLLVVDLILFHDSETVMAAIGMGAFAFCLGLFIFLDAREYRSRTAARRRSAYY